MKVLDKQLAKVPLQSGNTLAWLLLSGFAGFVAGWIACFHWLTSNFILIPPV